MHFTRLQSNKVRSHSSIVCHPFCDQIYSTIFFLLHAVTKLNDVRDDNTIYNNRLDTTLADVFSLLSLFYLTIGKTKDIPAFYSQIASMRVRPRAQESPFVALDIYGVFIANPSSHV